MAELKIRYRQRSGYSREAQGYTGWNEWQLVEGRKVIGRFDLEEQADRAKANHEAALAAGERDSKRVT